jgi:hypothetical protein
VHRANSGEGGRKAAGQARNGVSIQRARLAAGRPGCYVATLELLLLLLRCRGIDERCWRSRETRHRARGSSRVVVESAGRWWSRRQWRFDERQQPRVLGAHADVPLLFVLLFPCDSGRHDDCVRMRIPTFALMPRVMGVLRVMIVRMHRLLRSSLSATNNIASIG